MIMRKRHQMLTKKLFGGLSMACRPKTILKAVFPLKECDRFVIKEICHEH
jgi:hypothetical protein